ncbi:MAG: hypothetical protein H8E27_11180 [Verrucomicrobia subdivision 3 bacterium]|nr:hypothetical protein [Limisphaerales bacterium]
MKWRLVIGWILWGSIHWSQAADSVMPTVLAERARLILDDNGSKPRGGRLQAQFGNGAQVRAGAGTWARAKNHPNVWRATWKGKGHVPVAAYHGFKATNLVVEVTFRFGENSEPWHHQCFRIAADQRPAMTGHVVSAWANTDNDFIETGFLLQHIRKTPKKTILEDLLLDRQPLTLKPHIWYTAMLEIVGDEALFRLGDHVAYAQAEQIRLPKNLVSLTTGATWHEIKRVRIWEATPNPNWPAKKAATLQVRNPFTPGVHRYVKPQ